jgi:N-acetylglucosamine kinase-like BadF-type ATPase
MTIIADSGSTKTIWLLINKNGKRTTVQTCGINLHFIDNKKVTEILIEEISPYISYNDVEKLYFYGAGCGIEKHRDSLLFTFQDFFVNAEMSVETDMLAAARALAGNDAGIIGILGTGSNMCVYDGQKITEQQNSLGFILGDEGSGNYIGKKLLTSYFYGKMPKNIQTKFEEKYCPSLPDIINNVYHQPFPNRFLAGFALFAYENKDDAFINSLLTKCFDDFFQINMSLFEKKLLPLQLIGGVVYNFQEIIRHSAEKYGIKIEKSERDPMEGLMKYHLN